MKNFTANSRLVRPGDTFIAIKGESFDGHQYIDDAIASGAVEIVHQSPVAVRLPHVAYTLVESTPRYYALKCKQKCGNADEKLTLFGVTGTNGKTTTVYLFRHLLNDCGLISTVEYFDGKNTEPASHTTPDAAKLHELFAAMARNHLRYAAMELSSHSLAQERSAGVMFRCAIFTNLTGDHLDYHRTMDNYYQAKKLLFTSQLEAGGLAVINVDGPYGQRLYQELGCRKISFGETAAADAEIEVLELGPAHSVFRLAGQSYRTNLTGRHNVYNLAGVLLSLLDCGFTPAQLRQKLMTPILVPGRLERIETPKGVHFFVDYAHTDDALENVLKLLKSVATGRVLIVFGAGGNRDKTKRPRMGKAASHYADELIVTSDNPRNEEPLDIINEIVAGAEKSCRIEPDREQAIKLAYALAAPGDCVLVAGKGHETYQEAGGIRHHFSDQEIIQKLV